MVTGVTYELHPDIKSWLHFGLLIIAAPSFIESKDLVWATSEVISKEDYSKINARPGSSGSGVRRVYFDRY